MKAIEVHNLCKSYNDIEVVKDVSLTVEKGEIFGLLGANGAGKSTNPLSYKKLLEDFNLKHKL